MSILVDILKRGSSHFSRYQRTTEEDVTVTKMPPKFLGPIKGTNIIREDQKAHFEARLEPQNDPTMKVRWWSK